MSTGAHRVLLILAPVAAGEFRLRPNEALQQTGEPLIARALDSPAHADNTLGSKRRMTDYDRTDIPAGYDRARDHGPEVLDLWMRTVAEHVPGRAIARILDLGCGTGRFSDGLATQFDADVLGLDPSSKMLQLARDKQRNPRVFYILGRAEAIPLGPGSVDLIFMSMSLHHFTNRVGAAEECRRVVSNQGTIVIRTGTREQIPSYPYVPFFASSRALLEETLPESTRILALFENAQLYPLASAVVSQTIAPDWSTYADKLAAGGDSVLARLSRSEFEAGLTAIRRYAATDGPRAVVEPINIFVLSPRTLLAAA